MTTKVTTSAQPEDHAACSGHLMAIKDTMDVLGGKWKISIITALTFQPYRFKELARLIGVSPRMLSKELKDLELNELIQRKVYDTIPVSVEYSITPYGQSLCAVISSMHDWGIQHRNRIMNKHRN